LKRISPVRFEAALLQPFGNGCADERGNSFNPFFATGETMGAVEEGWRVVGAIATMLEREAVVGSDTAGRPGLRASPIIVA
jgi:hypothetical protein